MKVKSLTNKIDQLFFSNQTRTKITKNVLWQIADKFIRLGLGLVVGIWIARYFGPDLYGKFNYATAYIALLGSLATLGLDRIVTKDLVENPAQTPRIMGSACFLRLMGAIVLCLIANTSILLIRSDDNLIRLLVFILSLGVIFQSFTVVDFYYASKIQAKYSIIAKLAACVIITGVKIYLLLHHFTLQQLAGLTIAELFLASVFLLVFYNRVESIGKWKVSFSYCKSALKQSWPLILSGLVIGIYMKIDQIMIGNMLGDGEVGVFSAAVKISEIWNFLPTIMATSVYPVLIEIRKQNIALYQKRYLTLFRVMNCITIPVAFIITFCSGFIISTLYGAEYARAAPILSIHIWSGVFVFLGAGSSGFYIIEGLQRLYFRRTLTGAILNICLNLLVIPLFGGIGAAITTLIVSSFVAFFSEAITKPTRILFKLKLQSFLFFKHRGTT